MLVDYSLKRKGLESVNFQNHKSQFSEGAELQQDTFTLSSL